MNGLKHGGGQKINISDDGIHRELRKLLLRFKLDIDPLVSKGTRVGPRQYAITDVEIDGFTYVIRPAARDIALGR
jgi:hypothetical protein